MVNNFLPKIVPFMR